MHADVVVIGGGVAGLTSAVGLLESGLRIVVVESSPTLGGRARSWTDEVTGDTVDLGPHVLTNEHRNLLRLLQRLGTADEVVWRRENFLVLVGEESLVMRRYPLPAPLSLLPNLFRVRALSSWDLMSNTPVVLFAMGMREEEVLRLDAIAAETFLRSKGVTPRFIDWFWRSAAMTFMNVPLEQCSAGALLRVFRRMLVDNRFRFGFASGGLADLFAPAAAERINAAGSSILTGRSVRTLLHMDDRLTGVVLDDGTRIETRFCISTIPPQALQALVPDSWIETDTSLRQLHRFAPVPYISCYLWFDRKLTREQMWTRLWSPGNFNYDFYDLSNIRRGWRHRPSLIASNIIQSGHAGHLNDDQLIDTTVAEMASFVPKAAQARIVHARVHRIPIAIVAPHPGIESLRPPARTSVAGFFLAGDWTDTGLPFSMESAARSGWLAAEAIWAALGRPRALALPMEAAHGLARLLKPWPGRVRR